MSDKNLKGYVDDVTEILTSEEKAGEKEGKRANLQSVSPQIFAQSKKELLDMFEPLKKEQEGTLKSGKTKKIPPIISLTDTEILTAFEKIFNGYDTLKNTFNQKGNEKKPRGDNGLYLTREVYHGMIKHTKKYFTKRILRSKNRRPFTNDCIKHSCKETKIN